MSTLSEEYVTNIVSKIAAKNKLLQWRHSVREFESVGQNYFGVIIPVTLTGVNDQGDVKISVALKLAPTDERYRISGAVTLMFRREIYVYSILLEKYRGFTVSAKTIQPFIMPTLYLVEDEYCKEVIAMQDMCDLGFKPYKETFLDFDHITVALESLAQFHALSFILKENCSKFYDEVIEICTPLTEHSNKRYIEIMMDRLSKALSKFQDTPYVALLEKLKLNCGGIYDKAAHLVKGTCICHGDVWKENILFRYDQNNKPVSACLIDYQTTRLSSPAFDALYLIISSTNTALRKESYFKMLDVYYNMFCLMLDKRNLDPKLVYPRHLFDYDLKVVAPACLITANTALWLSNGLQEEGHVRSKLLFASPEEKDLAVDKYRSVVKAIIDDLYVYGYLPGDILHIDMISVDYD